MTLSQFPDFGYQPVINAAGNLTRFGGCRTFPKAIQAMADISPHFVDLDALHRRAGKHIAALIGVEGALVTTGAAAALVLAAAACMTGSDPYLRSRLPDRPPEKREFIIQRCHRNLYDRNILTSGARLVEVGNSVETHDWELAGAVNERTAGIIFFLWTADLEASLTLEETVRVAREHEVPLIVDAAAHLPPKANLWRLVEQGADLVAFSGGKDMRGPQSSGLLVGRGDLVEAAYLNGAPHIAVGRPMKAGKEIVAGLTAALECYLEEDEEERLAAWARMQADFIAALDGTAGWQARSYHDKQPGLAASYIPRTALYPPQKEPAHLQRLVDALDRGSPRIIVVKTRDAVLLNPMPLEGDEPQIIIERIQSILAGQE